MNHYDKDRDNIALGKFYTDHVSAMTREGLHAKSDIASELAFRDKQIAERDETIRQLRAQLDEYERAPTVATVRFDYDMFVNDRHWDYLDYDDPLPPVGTELIARPARKVTP